MTLNPNNLTTKQRAKKYLEQLRYEIAEENHIALQQGMDPEVSSKDNSKSASKLR